MPGLSPSSPALVDAMASKGHRIEGLDLLRGLAALGVVLVHFTQDFNILYHPARKALVSFPYGFYGVQLFFLISGFVIFMTVERAKRPLDFAISRFSRLYPAYWTAIIFTAAVLVLFPPPDGPNAARVMRRAAVNLTMFQSWVKVDSIDGVYWTLQAEMSFYIIMFLLIWRKATDRVLVVMTGLVLLSLADHMLVSRPRTLAEMMANPAFQDKPYEYVRKLLILDQAYLFTAGIVFYRARSGWKPSYGAILLLCAACPATAWYFPNNPPVDTAFVLGLSLIFYLACTGRMNFLINRPLLFLGTISYSLYLTHHMFGFALLRGFDRYGLQPDLALIITVVLSLIVATLMNVLIERPSLVYIRGHVRRLAPAATTSPSPASVESGLGAIRDR